MSDLSWSEQESVEFLVGGLANMAGLIAHRPDVAERVRLAVVERLGDDERRLVDRLASRSALTAIAVDVVGVSDPGIVHDDERVRFGDVRAAIEGGE